MKTYWTSFGCQVTGNNLGVTIVKAENAGEAIKKCWELQINPGGEALTFEIEEEEVLNECKRLGYNRLISTEELKIEDYEVTKV